MKRFVLSLGLIIAALFALCCCADGKLAETSREESENSVLSEESVSLDESVVSMETSKQTEETSEDAVDTAEPSEESQAQSVEDSSVEELSSKEQPVQSEPPSKEPETIPNLILGPQPEGGFHTLYVGESMQLYSQIEGSELEDAMLKWTVSDSEVIHFGSKRVTAVKAGTSTVTLSYSNGLKPVSITFVVLEREESSAESIDADISTDE